MRRLLVAALLVLAAGCGDATAESPDPMSVQVVRAIPNADGLSVDVYQPVADGPWPVVVLVPGGGWRSAELESTAPLAERLAERGAVVYNATYRLTAPEAFTDVACAVRLATNTAPERGGDPDRLVLAGVSAGAHVTSVVALASTNFCPGSTAAPSAWVGIAGPYDTAAFGFVPDLRRFFGSAPEADPQTWALGNPYSYLDEAPGVTIGLVHGESDIVVPIQQSRDLATRLTVLGAEPATTFVERVGHRGIVDPSMAGDHAVDMILDLAG